MKFASKKPPSSPPVTLVDMGYGLSQFLPVLVLCYYAPEGSTLILEQPGIHLHPMVQSQLADLLIEVVNERKLQILVESHSEHLLTRLQRRIAEKQIDQNNVALYFCRNNEGVSTIEKLDVDESGDIKNWPENFFGDVMGDMFAMTDKQVENIAEKGTEGLMDAVIIDTNVLVVANGKAAAPQASDKCITLCRARLAEILRGPEMVLLDDKKRFIQEYRNNLNEKGRGHGDRFWQELKSEEFGIQKVILKRLSQFVLHR